MLDKFIYHHKKMLSRNQNFFYDSNSTQKQRMTFTKAKKIFLRIVAVVAIFD